jgi:hypothetical protein
MLISMGSTAANPSTSPMPSGPSGQNGSASKPSMDDLFKRMKK